MSSRLAGPLLCADALSAQSLRFTSKFAIRLSEPLRSGASLALIDSVHSSLPLSDVLVRPTCLLPLLTPHASIGRFRATSPACRRADCPTPTPRPHSETPVAAANWLRYTYLARFARPKGNRQLFRLVKRQQVCRVVEIGISDLARAVSLIQVAQRFAGDKKVWYTGIDLFDARPTGSEALGLKETYRILRATEANVRLVPGMPNMSLASAANAHQNTDLILLGPSVTASDLNGAWFYVPRMLHANSVILSEQHDSAGQVSFQAITRTQIAEWASHQSLRRAA